METEAVQAALEAVMVRMEATEMAKTQAVLAKKLLPESLGKQMERFILVAAVAVEHLITQHPLAVLVVVDVAVI